MRAALDTLGTQLKAAIVADSERVAIGSLLVDNLNASIHLQALLTDVFIVDQALRPR